MFIYIEGMILWIISIMDLLIFNCFTLWSFIVVYILVFICLLICIYLLDLYICIVLFMLFISVFNNNTIKKHKQK